MPPGWRSDRAGGGRSSDGLGHFQGAGGAGRVFEDDAPWYASIKSTGTTLPAGTVTFWPLPDTVAVTVRGGAVRGLGDSAHRAGRDAVKAARHAARRGPRGDHEVRRQRGTVADHVDGDRPLVAGERPGDDLGDEQGAGGGAVGVGDVGRPSPARRDRDVVRAADDGHRDGAGVPVRGLGYHAVGGGGDTGVDLRLVACGRPGRDDEVGREGGAVADRVDNHLPLLPGKQTGNRLRHLELARERARRCR